MSDILDDRKLLEKQHLEIQSRLDRYCAIFYEDEECYKNPQNHDELQKEIDIFKELALLQDSLKDKKVDLCFCERENICNCVSETECECDGEDYYTVSDVEIIQGSNSNMIFEFTTLNDVSISRLKNVRFFTLDKETDDERWVMDLVKIIEKRKKKKVVSKYFLKTKKRYLLDNSDGYIQYEIFDVPHLRGKRIQIKIDYLQYYQL